MAKELMEIGGFITEGAEIVNHDASLSGNGTVDSPLGVVPGYNETVLWTNPGTNGNTPTKDITWSNQSLSESIANFERVMFIYSTDQTNYAKKCIIFDVKSANDTYALFDIVAGSICMLRYAAFTLNNTSISNYSNYTRNITFPTNGTVTSSGDTFGYNILYKVVGINRIANN